MKRIIALCAAAILCLTLLSACSGDGGKDSNSDRQVDLAAFAQTVLDNHEFASFVQRVDLSDEEFGAVMLENSFPGLAELDLEQLEVYLCMVSFNSGEFTLAQAKNAEDAAKVYEIFEARVASMTEEGVNYPDTIELWSAHTQIVSRGNYVMLVCHEDSDAIVNEFNALFE